LLQETIRRNLPVVVYENDGGFSVTKDMIETMHIPADVQKFDMPAFLKSLQYQPAPHQPSALDIFWLPPGHVLLNG
jgi:hypothetical protein